MSYTRYNVPPSEEITPEQEVLTRTFNLMGLTLAALVTADIMSVPEARTMLGLENA